jgi:hypothetical protein
MNMQETGMREGEFTDWSNGVAGNFKALARLASSAQVRQSFCMAGLTKRWDTSLVVALTSG